jgi:fluoroquinolone resistance protein
MDAQTRLIQEQGFEGEEFIDLDLKGADLSHKEFVRCVFRRVHLTESSWTRTRLDDCVFDSCDLTRIKPAKLSFQGTELIDCRLMGVDWSDIGANPTFAFERCNLRYASFVKVNLTGTRFSSCKIVEAHFIDSRLVESDFTNSDMTGSRFEHCDLARANFAETTGLYIDTTLNRVKGMRINVATAVLLASALGMRVSGFDDEDKPGTRDRR